MKAVRTALNRWQDGDGDSMTSDIPQFDDFEPSYKLIPNVFGEQAPEEVPTEEPAPPPEETTPAEPQADPAAMQDPSTMGGEMGVDPSMGNPAAMGMGMEPEGPTSPIEVGRLYELKKIHSRLVSVQSFLADSTDPQLSELKQYVNQSIELFRTLISNIQLFKDQLDDIIVMYYNFLDTIFAMLSKYYKTNTDGPSKYVRTWGK